MINKLIFLGTELKQSLVFIILITIEIFVCICLLNYAFSKLDEFKSYRSYFNEDVAEFISVNVNNTDFENKTVGEISELVNLTDLAVSLELGNIWDIIKNENTYDSIGLMTPLLKKHFNLPLMENLEKENDYIKAYIKDNLEYEINKIYDVSFKTEDGKLRKIKIKPIAYFPKAIKNSFFTGDSIGVKKLPYDILICDNLEDYDYLKFSGGIFCNDKTSNYYKSLGFNAQTVEEMYQKSVENDKDGTIFLFYASGVAMFFTFVSILCLYFINFNDTIRKRTINYICGVSEKKQLFYEAVKMMLIISISFVLNLIFSAIVYDDNFNFVLQSPKNSLIATVIVIAMYSITLIIGMIGLTKDKAIENINNEH